MMFCKKATSLLTEAKEGKLKGVQKLAFDFHLTVCPSCKRCRAQLDATVETLGKLPKEEAPPGLLDLLAGELGKKS